MFFGPQAPGTRPPLCACSPRSYLRCRATQMVRSTAISLLILAGMALTPTEISAASITYSIVNYPTLQNGYTVTGTITTNGATGTALPGTDITSWNITISLGSTAVATLTPSDSTNFTFGFDATSTTITAATFPSDDIIFRNEAIITGIEWNIITSPSTTQYNGVVNETFIWNTPLPTPDSPIATVIATVPEPSSALLASIGAVAAFLAYGWSRHRRAQRRQAAT
jgi:hypothetical protein